MPANARTWFLYLAPLGLLWAVFWSLSFGTLPPADFTFVNGTEIQSVDPSIITGQPEGRIAWALFEGLTAWHPETLEPTAGVAERWDLSDDRLTYTFFLRPDARWSDGSTVTAENFHYSFRRFLDPITAAKYAYQMWYVKNAKKYYAGPLETGDPVEVELDHPTPGDLPLARGEVLRGKLRGIEEITDAEAPAPQKVYVVEVGGRARRFSTVAASGAEKCRQVLLDFSEVGIQVVDEHTLRITLENPTPFFLNLTGFYPLSPVNRRCLETHGRQWVKPENLVTNGAYRLEFRRIRDRLRLVKNEYYWNRDKVRMKTIDALAVESPVTGLNLYMTGQADWIPTVPPSTVAALRAEKRDDFVPVQEFTTYFYRLNVTKPPLDDVRVRRALALAMDKREIVETVTQAGEVVARSLVPPGLKNYDPPQLLEHDPERARALLAEAGFPDGQGIPTITILYNNDESHKSIAELIQDQWRRNLGIATQLEATEWGSFLSRQHQLKFTVCRAGWTGDYMDANTFLDMFVTDGANNQTGWSHAEYDRLVERAASKEISAAERKVVLEQAEAILLAEMPVIPIYFKVSKNMVRPYVHGFFHNVRDTHPLGNLWVDQNAKRKSLSLIGR